MEHSFVVMSVEDIKACLTEKERRRLDKIIAKQQAYRMERGLSPLRGLFFPEYHRSYALADRIYQDAQKLDEAEKRIRELRKDITGLQLNSMAFFPSISLLGQDEKPEPNL